MRVEGLVKVGVGLMMGGFAAAGVAQTALPVVITGCVSKVDGSTRIVAGPGNCFTNLETVTQWNQAGAPYATGPVSANTGHVLYVPTDGTGASSGLYFVQAMNNLAGVASASTPYQVVLGPGTYQLPSAGVYVPPFVSIRGAGMNTTILQGVLTFVSQTPPYVENSFDVDDLSVVRGASQSAPTTTMTIPYAGNITFDHVFTDGITSFNSTSADSSIILSNSVFKFPLTVNYGATGSHVAVLNTEVDVLQNISGGMSVVCSGVYNEYGALYTNACVAPALPPSGP